MTKLKIDEINVMPTYVFAHSLTVNKITPKASNQFVQFNNLTEVLTSRPVMLPFAFQQR